MVAIQVSHSRRRIPFSVSSRVRRLPDEGPLQCSRRFLVDAPVAGFLCRLCASGMTSKRARKDHPRSSYSLTANCKLPPIPPPSYFRRRARWRCSFPVLPSQPTPLPDHPTVEGQSSRSRPPGSLSSHLYGRIESSCWSSQCGQWAVVNSTSTSMLPDPARYPAQSAPAA
jgi:hypothetical protein